MLATYRAVIGADPSEFDSARDDSGHGTHTASTAAGNADVPATMFGKPVATIAGIAPRAEIVAYKALGERGGFTSDLAAAIDQAVSDGVDVINYSISGSAGTPGADEVALLFAADAGVFVAAAAGNGGPDPSTVGNPASMPWVTSVGASTQRRTFRGLVILGNGQRYTGASLTGELPMTPLVDGEDSGSPTCEPGALDPAASWATSCYASVERSEDSSRARRSLEAGGVGMIVYDASDTGDRVHRQPLGTHGPARQDAGTRDQGLYPSLVEASCADRHADWRRRATDRPLAPRPDGALPSRRAARTRSPRTSSSPMSSRRDSRSSPASHRSRTPTCHPGSCSRPWPGRRSRARMSRAYTRC